MVAGGDIPGIESLEVETVPEPQEISRWESYEQTIPTWQKWVSDYRSGCRIVA